MSTPTFYYDTSFPSMELIYFLKDKDGNALDITSATKVEITIEFPEYPDQARITREATKDSDPATGRLFYNMLEADFADFTEGVYRCVGRAIWADGSETIGDTWATFRYEEL